MALSSPATFSNLTTADTHTVHSGNAILERVVVNQTSAGGTIVIYDSTTGSGDTVATLPASAAVGGYEYGLYCATGITVVTGGAFDLTVVYTPMG